MRAPFNTDLILLVLLEAQLGSRVDGISTSSESSATAIETVDGKSPVKTSSLSLNDIYDSSSPMNNIFISQEAFCPRGEESLLPTEVYQEL